MRITAKCLATTSLVLVTTAFALPSWAADVDATSAIDTVTVYPDGATVTRVIKLVDRSEYKRRQAPPGLKVTSRAFGFGRRMPIAQRYEPLPAEHGEPSPSKQ